MRAPALRAPDHGSRGARRTAAEGHVAAVAPFDRRRGRTVARGDAAPTIAAEADRGGARRDPPRCARRVARGRRAVPAAAAGALPEHRRRDVAADRALHWLRRAPRELAAVVRVGRRYPAVIVGRTEKAHRSHHLPLYATEVVANRLLAARLGLTGRIDLLVPSFIMTDTLVRQLVTRSRARGEAIYGEWAALVVQLGRDVAYLECRGLDWETPDRHRRSVRRVGLPAWRNRWSSPAEWDLRIDMPSEILRGATRALAGAPHARPIRRLPRRVG